MRRYLFASFALAFSLGCSSEPGTSNPDPGSDTGASDTSNADGANDGANDAGDDVFDSGCKFEVPTSYDSPDYATNAAKELGFRTSLAAFMDPMKAAEADVSKKPAAEDLKKLFDGGTPTLKSITTPYYAAKIEGLLDAFAAAAGNKWTPSDPPSGSGGIFGKWIFDAHGTDLRQRIEKGMFAAAFYNYAQDIVSKKGELTEASIDRLVAVYGAHPSFPQADKDVPHPDVFVALYAKRRDDKTQATGLYRRIKSSLIRAKAAIRAKCDADRDAALASFLLDWERAELATVIFYLNDAAKKLSGEPPKVDDQAAGLHGYGEAAAFIHGFRTVAGPRRITDAQIDELLTLLGSPHEGSATSYKLITSPGSELPKFATAISKIASIYGFTPQEVESFKTNH